MCGREKRHSPPAWAPIARAPGFIAGDRPEIVTSRFKYDDSHTLDRYLAVSLEFLGREGRDSIADEGCRVEPGAWVERSVLWRRVRVEAGARLEECLVGDDVRIPGGAEFRRVAIVRAELAAASERPAKAAPGEIVGENLVVPF